MGSTINHQPEVAAAGVQARRQAMPEVAAFVDLCRAAYGGQFVDVDAAMATAQQARREHAQVLTEQGIEAAARWLVRNANRCTFHAEEAGRSVGLRSPWGRHPSSTEMVRPTPPIGTPPAKNHGGNSTPARAPVAGVGQSEQVGGQVARSPAPVALVGGVHHG